MRRSMIQPALLPPWLDAACQQAAAHSTPNACPAGENPCMLTALKQLPSELGSAIGPEHVNGG